MEKRNPVHFSASTCNKQEMSKSESIELTFALLFRLNCRLLWLLIAALLLVALFIAILKHTWIDGTQKTITRT
jgi:hypothetical protein